MRISLMCLIGFIFIMSIFSVHATDTEESQYTLPNYFSCLINKENCLNENMAKQANMGLCLFTLLALGVYFYKGDKLGEIFKKKKKKLNYHSHRR